MLYICENKNFAGGPALCKHWQFNSVACFMEIMEYQIFYMWRSHLWVRLTIVNNLTTNEMIFVHSFKWKYAPSFIWLKKCVYVIWMVGGKNKIPVLHICVYCKQPLLSFRYQSYSVMFTVTLQQEIIISFDRKSFVLILAEFFFPMHLSQIVTKKEIKGYLLFVRGGRYHNVIYSDICNKRI